MGAWAGVAVVRNWGQATGCWCCGNEPSGSMKYGELVDQLRDE